MRLLVAEDERDMRDVIVKKLTAEGYAVDACADGRDALEYLLAAVYDGAVLDVMMPEIDGFTLLTQMRARGIATPVIFLTARDSIDDRVRGLDLGANDYLIKPFSFAELTARLRALTRRASGNITNIYTAADLVLDADSRTVTRGGKPVVLSAKEFAVLEILIRNKGRTVSREQIENGVWNYDYGGGTNVVDVYIRYLRQKVDTGYDVQLIHTVRGVGYVLGDRK